MTKRVVLNLQQTRAERSITTPVIVDFDGVEHPINNLDLDAFLAIMEIEQEFRSVNPADRDSQLRLIGRLKDLITVVLPGFPVGGLQLDELMQIGQILQLSVAPDQAPGDETGVSDTPGE